MPELNNLKNLIWLLYYLFPFVIVFTLLIISGMQQDMRAALMLVGACIATLVSVVIFPFSSDEKVNCRSKILFAIGEKPVTKLQLNFVFYVYLLAYMTTGIVSHQTVKGNVSTFLVFTIICIAEIVRAFTINQCEPSQPINMRNISVNLLLALLVGTGVGVLWAFTVIAIGRKDLLYMSGLSARPTCKVMDRKFTCKDAA